MTTAVDASVDTYPVYCHCLLQQKWEEEELLAQQYEWGLCMDCGCGLVNEEDFFVDNRDSYGCSNTCNRCFEECYGKAAFDASVSWQELGLEKPQYTRVWCCK